MGTAKKISKLKKGNKIELLDDMYYCDIAGLINGNIGGIEFKGKLTDEMTKNELRELRHYLKIVGLLKQDNNHKQNIKSGYFVIPKGTILKVNSSYPNVVTLEIDKYLNIDSINNFVISKQYQDQILIKKIGD
jgi:hypothetical protein